MQLFKKCLASVTCFILAFVGLSLFILVPYVSGETYYFLDAKNRQSLAGSIDYIVIGASHGACAFDPRVLDKELGCNSYNLSGSMMTMSDKMWMLKKEIERNPIKTVVFEISYDTLSRKHGDEYAIGEETTIARMDTWKERLSYMLQYVTLDDWLNVYARAMVNGYVSIFKIVTHDAESAVDYTKKGLWGKESVDLSLDEAKKTEIYNPCINIDYSTLLCEETVEEFDNLLRLCHEKGIETIIVCVPVSDAEMLTDTKLDSFDKWMRDYASNHDSEYYDFNLIKHREVIFAEENSYSDGDHMSEIGAARLTKEFCTVINNRDDVFWLHEMFYETYNELKYDIVYHGEGAY